MKIVGLLSVIVTVLSPVTAVLMRITNGIIRLFGGKTDGHQPFITEEELKTMINVSHEEGVLEEAEKKMIHNVFEFGDSRVSNVMVPRIDIAAVEIQSSYEEIINVFKRECFSRLPVYKDNIDNIVGVLYLKDMIFFDDDKDTFDIKSHMRDAYFTFELKLITQLFNEMKDKRIPMAVVIDEYGGTAGIITMEDLVEEIMGDIQDEYDEQHNEIEVVQEDEYIVDGVAKIDFINEMIGINIESEGFDSIGGFVIGLFGRFPENGEKIEYNSIKFVVESMDRNRVERLRILT